MEAAPDKSIIVLAATAVDAGSVAAGLRSAGHRVHIVPNLEAARNLMATQKAELLLCDPGAILQEGSRSKVRRGNLKATMTGLALELRSLLTTLAESIDELSHLTAATPFVGRADALARGRRRLLKVREFIDDLLAEAWTGAAEELQIREANLEDLVEGAAIAVYSEACRKDQRLVINIDAEAARVRADRAKLKRVLTNLLSNAVRRAPVAGTVTVDARREDRDCLIAVSASGDGASAAGAPDVLRTGGAGDGARRRKTRSPVAIVKGLVELHGGRVWAESRPGGGTTVFVSLPQPPTPEEERLKKTGH